MSIIKSYKFKEIGKVVTGTTPSKERNDYYGRDIPFVTPVELGYSTPVVSAKTYLSLLGAQQAKLIPKNSVMVCCIGSLGKVGFSGRELATNQQINSIIFDESKVYPRYGFHFCLTLQPLLQHIAPATTIPIVNKSKFEELELPLPPLEEQKRIAHILDLADNLRAKRQQALARLDALLQSTFLEMFGDPMTNPKGWEVKELGEVLTEITYGLTVRPKYENDGIPLISARELRGGSINYVQAPKISEEAFAQLSIKSKPKKGDILFSKTGTIGLCAEVLDETVFAITQNAARLRFDSNFFTNKFLLGYLKSNFFQTLASKSVKGNAVQDLQLGVMKKFPIYIPPLQLQQKYEFIFNKILNQQIIQNSSQTHLNTLFSALQQRAFSGRL